ncbi:fusaric acid resistance family protein, partial [Vibrio parahaemolyticus V-223/04]
RPNYISFRDITTSRNSSRCNNILCCLSSHLASKY